MGAITKNEIRKWVFEATEDCFKRLIAAQTYHTNERLTKDQALAFLDGRGYKTTISKLYKLSAAGEIPSTKINGKLSFLKSDLQEWVDQQIEHDVSRANAGKLLAESAMRKKVEGTVCRIIISSPVLASGGIFLCLFLQIGANCVSNGKKLGVANYCNPLIFNCGEYEIRTRDLLHAMQAL